jgi:xanthine/uracil permease
MTAATLAKMAFGKRIIARWFALAAPSHFDMPSFDPIMTLTLLRVEATGMFLALGESRTEKSISSSFRQAVTPTVSVPSSARRVWHPGRNNLYRRSER